MSDIQLSVLGSAIFALAMCVVLFVGVASAQSEACTGDAIFNAAVCIGDEASEPERQLLKLVSEYRLANGGTAVNVSPALNKLANRRILDLTQNLKSISHSWSNCPYSLTNQSTWHCVMDAPRRLKVGYGGKGYEVLYRTARGDANAADSLEAWKRSRLHNSIILNVGDFESLKYDAIGVAIDGGFAVIWFGSLDPNSRFERGNNLGLGASFDEAVKGLVGRLNIDRVSSTIDTEKWTGASRDKKLTLDIFGSRADIREASFRLRIQTNADRSPDSANRESVIIFLKNVFPEWTDSAAWIDRSMKELAATKGASKTKLIRDAIVEVSGTGSGFQIVVQPKSAPKPMEIF